jgi:hypothetical protein
VYRSAVSGLFISETTAKRNPSTTIKQEV